MSLASGTRLGPYEILGPLGAGGMGEVYKARDTRLDRIVAIKVIGANLSTSPEARQRFEREAKTLSRLSHPHICTTFDVGHQDGADFLVMEFLEGETLAQRLARGPLPVEQTLGYGVDIADALEKAHRQGIVHRDLKPANVMITTAGIKLLDFGLAKAMAPLTPGSDPIGGTTIAAANLTGEGTILGTVPYMSPEQIEGGAADARSDIFAFGSVLYEMATGHAAFGGDSRAAVASAVLRAEPPPISSLQPASPGALDRLVKTCLAKDPEQRWQTAHDVGLQLAGLLDASRSTSSSASSTGARRRRVAIPHWLPWIAAAAAVLGAFALGRSLAPPSARPADAPIRFSMAPPAGGVFRSNSETIAMALAPDGSRLAFVAVEPSEARRVWMRPLSEAEAQPMAGTEGATSVFWSPDSRAIAFFSGGQLKRIDLPGGAAVIICEVPQAIGLFGTWGTDGQILFASVEGDAIYRVSTAGGTPVAVITRDRTKGQVRVVWPRYLPDAGRFLYMVRTSDRRDRLMFAEPGRPDREVMLIGSNVDYVDPGYLVFAREGTLMGQRFDAVRGEVSGEPFAIAQPLVYYWSTAAAEFSASRNGVVVYQSHRDQARIDLIDRAGQKIRTVAPSGQYQTLRLSPDGRRVLFDRVEPSFGTFDLWEIDLERGVETRLTADRTSEAGGTWLPGGRSIMFGTDRGGPPHLFRKDLASGAEVEVLPPGRLQLPQDVSPDGKLVAYIERSLRGNFDVMLVPLDGSAPPSALLSSPFDELSPRFSPDGRTVAFSSDESGMREIYVSAFPVTGQKTRVSTRGGRAPRWSASGRELYYSSPDRQIMMAPMGPGSPGNPGTPVALFTMTGDGLWQDFDVTADARRFVAIISEVIGPRQPLDVIVHWPAAIGRQ